MDAIRSLRRAAGVTQSELAQAARTSQPTVAAYEAGRKSPTLGTLRRMAEAVHLEASVTFHPPMTREERRSLQLHEAIAERLVEHPGEVMVRVRRTLERMSAGPAGTSPPLREWRREIGIRAALGAQPRRLLAGVLGRAAWQLGAGALLGRLFATAIDVYLPEDVLRAVGGWNVPGVLPATAMIMISVGLLAALGPARRGLSVDPTEAMRGAG